MSKQDKNKSNTNKGNSQSGKKISLKEDRKRSDITIDEFGQLVRKPKKERSLRYLTGIFTSRNLCDVLRMLVFVCVLFTTYWSASSHESVFHCILQFVMFLLVWLVFDLISYEQRNLSDIEDKASYIISLLFALVCCSFFNILFYDNQYQDKNTQSNNKKKKLKPFRIYLNKTLVIYLI